MTSGRGHGLSLFGTDHRRVSPIGLGGSLARQEGISNRDPSEVAREEGASLFQFPLPPSAHSRGHAQFARKFHFVSRRS